jgi:membrane dipeptidase
MKGGRFNVKIYDTHCDIFDNLFRKYRNGVGDPFLTDHLSSLRKGEIAGGIWVIYSESDFDIVSAYQDALKVYAPYEDKFSVIKGLEGLRNVKDLATLDKLYQMGIRHSSLTWNEANHLAGGVKGPKEVGLSALGKTFIAYMNEKKMIVDVSHLNEKSFYDVLSERPRLLIASHSNSRSLSEHPRNLTDHQLKALQEAGGMIGAVAARRFVSLDPLKQNIKGLVDQIEYLINIMGEDHVMLGLDMMDFLPGYVNDNLDDLRSHGDAQGIVKEMFQRGFSETLVKKISHQNFEKLLQRSLL